MLNHLENNLGEANKNASSVNSCFLNSSSDFPVPVHVAMTADRGSAQRVRGLYSGSLLIFSFSVSLSSRAITRECE